MADDPTKTKQDRNTVDLSDPNELRHFKDAIRREFPKVGDDELQKAIEASGREIAHSESREKLAEGVRRRLES